MKVMNVPVLGAVLDATVEGVAVGGVLGGTVDGLQDLAPEELGSNVFEDDCAERKLGDGASHLFAVAGLRMATLNKLFTPKVHSKVNYRHPGAWQSLSLRGKLPSFFYC